MKRIARADHAQYIQVSLLDLAQEAADRRRALCRITADRSRIGSATPTNQLCLILQVFAALSAGVIFGSLMTTILPEAQELTSLYFKSLPESE